MKSEQTVPWPSHCDSFATTKWHTPRSGDDVPREGTDACDAPAGALLAARRGSRAVESVTPETVHILVVDETARTRDRLVRALQEFGWTVEGASVGDDGLEAARRVAPHVIVLDLA